MTLRGEGNAARRSGPEGDLIVLIDERDHELFIRDEDNIYMEIVLNIAQAVMGVELEIPTLTGKVKLKVLPFPISLSTQILPPCISTIDLVMVKPSPEPPKIRVVSDFACSNRSNINFSSLFMSSVFYYYLLKS